MTSVEHIEGRTSCPADDFRNGVRTPNELERTLIIVQFRH